MRPGILLSLLAVLGAAFFLVFVPNAVEVLPGDQPSAIGHQPSATLPQIPEPQPPTSTQVAAVAAPSALLSDLPNQRQLQNPPEVIKGIYVTAWVAGSAKRMDRIIDLIKRTELNAVVIDIKDFSGHISYRTGIPEVVAAGAEKELRILQPNALIKRLHDAGIYVIARQTVFQDPILAKARPEWAIHDASKLATSSPLSSSSLWRDHKGLHWMDPAAKPVWDYNIAIAKDAFARGFDEVNFDYIRFASDGNLNVISYPFWDGKTPRHNVIRNFFKYLRENLPGKKISADLFGLAAVDTWDDLGIGQVIEDAYEYFDYVCPMVYPSHYAKGTLGYQNPAEHPYEIVKYSMDQALARLRALTMKTASDNDTEGGEAQSPEAMSRGSLSKAKLRPWLQDFDLGATYDAQKVRAQIQATYDALLVNLVGDQTQNPNAYYNGWLLWSPSNNYTEGALESEISN